MLGPMNLVTYWYKINDATHFFITETHAKVVTTDHIKHMIPRVCVLRCTMFNAL